MGHRQISEALVAVLVRLAAREHRIAQAADDLAAACGDEERRAIGLEAARRARRRADTIAQWLPPDVAPPRVRPPLRFGRSRLGALERLHRQQVQGLHRALERTDGALYSTLLEDVLLDCVRMQRRLQPSPPGWLPPRWVTFGGDAR